MDCALIVGEWMSALMEHICQSVMWAGITMMPRWCAMTYMVATIVSNLSPNCPAWNYAQLNSQLVRCIQAFICFQAQVILLRSSCAMELSTL